MWATRAASLIVVASLAPGCRTRDALPIGPTIPTTGFPIYAPADRPPAGGGYEIVAGWSRPYRAYFDVVGDSLYWTDGHDVFVGPDFDHGVGLGIAKPPNRWVSDASGIYWTTAEGELWHGRRGQAPRVLWRYRGHEEELALGRDAVYVVVERDWRRPDPDPAKSMREGVRELWRVEKRAGEATRLEVARGNTGELLADGDAVFIRPFEDTRVVRIDGAGARRQTFLAGFYGLFGVDDHYLYGGDSSHIYRAPKTGGRGIAIAAFDGGAVTSIWTRIATHCLAALEGDRLYWIEWGTLYTAPTGGGARRPLVGLSGGDFRVVPAGGSVYVGDFRNQAIYRVSAGAIEAPVTIPTESQNATRPAVNSAQLFWTEDGEIWAMSRSAGEGRLLARTPQVDSALAADETHVYFTSSDGDLWRVAGAGGDPAKIVDVDPLFSEPSPRGVDLSLADTRTVGLDGEEVYFISRGRGLVRAKKSGAAPRVLARVLASPRSLLQDERHLYFLAAEGAAPGRARLLRLSKSGGAPQAIGGPLQHPTDLTMTDAAFYVADDDERRVLRIAKPTGEPSPIPFSTYELNARDGRTVVTLGASDSAVFISTADRILKLEEGASTPRVVASGLLWPAAVIVPAGDSLYYVDTHTSKGRTMSSLYALRLTR
jgi:hypothetical protein